MSAAAIAAIAVTAVLVAALASYLIWVVLILRRLSDTLGKVVFGVSAIAHRVQPIGPLVGELNSDLGSVADALEALARDVGGQRRPSGEASATTNGVLL
jgi:hypothetical protein